MKKLLFLIFCNAASIHTMENSEQYVTKDNVFDPGMEGLTKEEIRAILGRKKNRTHSCPEGRLASPTLEAVLQNEGDFTLDQVKAALGKKKSKTKLDAAYLENLCIDEQEGNQKKSFTTSINEAPKKVLRSKSCS